MKFRNALTNVFYVVILLSLIAFLLFEFGAIELSGEGVKKVVSTLLLALAVLSVAVIEIVLPLIANRDMLSNTKYLVRAVIKTLLLLSSAAVLFLYEPFGVIKSMIVALVVFCVAYFLQFFISLEPSVEKKNSQKAVSSDHSGSAKRPDARSSAPETISDSDSGMTFEIDESDE